MLGLLWFFHILSFPLGLACVFVSLDMLYVWGVEGRRRKGGHPPRPPMPPRPRSIVNHYPSASRAPGMHGRPPLKQGVRPYPDAWIWWEWQIRRPALYLFFLGTALVTVGVLMWLPGFGHIPWVSKHIEGIAVLILGLILLRGTIKISSPIIWKKITIIKRPLSGRARPSLAWMGVGLAFCIAGLYGLACDFVAPTECIGGNLEVIWGLVFTILEFTLGGIAAMGLEDIVQAWQEGESPAPRSLLFFGVGFVCFIAVLIGRAAIL